MNTSLAPTDHSIDNLKSIAEDLLGTGGLVLESIEGGRNSRVYRLVAPNGCYAFKTYFRHASDSRARMETEFESLEFLWENGERMTPRPMAAASGQDCAIYEWIDGEKIAPGQVTGDDIRTACAFLARLAHLKDRSGAACLRPASEACFSARALVHCLRNRLDPLLERSGHAGFADFLRDELCPALDATCAWSRDRLGDAFDRDLPQERRTLSPSDFGFHNALRQTGGRLMFLDFEYFGWDDPVKMICDFLLHPGMQVPPDLKRMFAASMLREFPEAAARIAAFYPLYGLKWCLILLNEFLPAHLLRRQFAGMSEHEREIRQTEQLAKSRSMLRVVLADNYRFPYGD
ncbi:MAG TPA: aminoglycoside phosphotransferase family protein [Candidatus Acidoferrales bacterium]|nr:aminoglycoside phosphotransferase family protein [Candidatus Acidoferrales bacterium]